MIINNRQELKDYLREILEACGTKAICKICHTKGRDVAFDTSLLVSEPCCAKMTCEWYQTQLNGIYQGTLSIIDLLGWIYQLQKGPTPQLLEEC